MKNLITFILTVCLILTANLNCFAADSENPTTPENTESVTLIIDKNAQIIYLTTVVDLNTDAIYHAKIDQPAVVEATLGHQYTVSVNANMVTSYWHKSIPVYAHYNIGDQGFTLNYAFSGASPISQSYSFNLPEKTAIKYNTESAYLGSSKNTWNKVTGNQGIKNLIHTDIPLQHNFMFEVVEDSALAGSSEPELLETSNQPTTIDAPISAKYEIINIVFITLKFCFLICFLIIFLQCPKHYKSK